MNIERNLLVKYWYEAPDKIRFLIVGLFNAFVAYSIYVLSCFILGEASYQISLAVSWILSSFSSFLIHRHFVFQGNGKWFKEYSKCCMTWFVSYLINAYLLEFIVKQFRLNIFISQIIAAACAAIFTYCVFKKYVFKHKK